VVAGERRATTSYRQRRPRIGRNRAASPIERMEEDGVISRSDHNGVREVLLPEHEQR
jgi:S-DNA-T family DNA segregation ATPase FtsK/SpoIIIE